MGREEGGVLDQRPSANPGQRLPSFATLNQALNLLEPRVTAGTCSGPS